MDLDSRQQTMFDLPTVRLPPFGELAAAGRRCERLQTVRRLAEWVGDRRVTKAGNLTLADARAAVQELGLPDYPSARTANRFPELHTLWRLAVELEFLEVKNGRAEFGAALQADSDSEIVELWVDLLSITLHDAVEQPGDEAKLMPLLVGLYLTTGGVTIDDLTTHVAAASFDVGVDEITTALRSINPQFLGMAFGPIVQSHLATLEAIDAVVLDGEEARLTDLGRFGLACRFEMGGIGAPFVTDLAEATVAQILDLGLTEDQNALFDEWLAARGVESAIESMFEHARGGTPLHRVVAFGMLNQFGPEAGDRIRACFDDRDLRPHANAWLNARGLPAGEATLDDLHRVFIDMVAADLDAADGEALAVRDSIRELAEDAEYDAVQLFENLWQCEHPQTLEVLEALSRHHPDPAAAKAARKAVRSAAGGSPASSLTTTYQLKVTLKGTKPPIWRRIEVPGWIALSGLHAVIQVAMGWTNSHLHEFAIGGCQYGEIDDDAPEELLGEAGYTLAEVVGEGERFEYLYDFGDGWDHAVTIEKVVPSSGDASVARCLAGRRNCPPEDVGGASGLGELLNAYDDPAHEKHSYYRDWLGDGYDAAAFDLDETNAELAKFNLDGSV
jgi:hypothetical protein